MQVNHGSAPTWAGSDEGYTQETHQDPTNKSEQGSQGSGDVAAKSSGTKKKRRSRKGLDKRFECTFEGCGKSYSRAEHLNRHQLNHGSSQVYHCDYPGCSRSFVRADLLKRHIDRHSAKADPKSPGSRPSTSKGNDEASSGSPLQHNYHDTPMTDTSSATFSSIQHPERSQNYNDLVRGPKYQPLNSYHNGDGTGHSFQQYPHSYDHSFPPPPAVLGQNQGTVSSQYPPQHIYHQANSYGNVQYYANAPAVTHADHSHRVSRTSGEQAAHGTSIMPHAPFNSSQSQSTRSQASEMMMLDQMAMAGAGPVFGSDSALQKSPAVGMSEDFMAYLFNSATGNTSPGSAVLPPPSLKYVKGPKDLHNALLKEKLSYGDLQHSQYAPQTFELGAAAGSLPTVQHNVMALNNIIDSNTPEATISEERSQEIFDFIRDRFHGNEHHVLKTLREAILAGDRSNHEHMLSRQMMQAYIWSYWSYFSDQIPILHTPSFSAEKCPILLLLVILAIGATCLDKAHGTEVTRAGTKVSSFIAAHLRWEIFMDPSFRPPAKLWVFQTLILLELYEKMCSTRELHERAHIHHATTITLMRRGRSLIGKSSLDSPLNPHGAVQNSEATDDREEWWNNWIINESTRRTACAAFVIDSIHCSMFGHSGVMVAHEMRLPLPCDESLWKAKSGVEFGRAEADLNSRGIKPISFLEGLKRTLGKQEVTTPSFGRTIIMAGLLSVTYHMQQRDLQMNMLGGGVVQALGGPDKWRAALTRGYDFWKQSYDRAVEQNEPLSDPYRRDSAKTQLSVIFESRTVLHNLAHMAMHADIVDCQIFARAKRLLGRPVGTQEFNNAEKRIKQSWANSVRGRDAAFYALQLLRSVLAPDLDQRQDRASSTHNEPYEARHDVLLNRPWVLYYAALVVWSYGYAVEGPCPHLLKPETTRDKWEQMRAYLAIFSRLSSPNGLSGLAGINHNTGLLLMLKETFENSTWELLHEAATLLQNCITLNSGALIS